MDETERMRNCHVEKDKPAIGQLWMPIVPTVDIDHLIGNG